MKPFVKSVRSFGRIFFLVNIALSLVPLLLSASTAITLGEQVTLHSTVLGEDRTVFVSVPTSYVASHQRYPVLYLTDAPLNFAQTATTAQFLAREIMIPEMIVVGITNPDRTRDLYATRADFKQGARVIPFPNSGHADEFLEFITKELIPWAEKTYRTSGFRILAGQSAGGNFALHAVRTKPGVFQAVMVASPWLTWDDSRELKELEPFLRSSSLQLRTLFFSSAGEGKEMKESIDGLIAAVNSRHDKSLRWGSRSYPDETHDSTSIKSYYDGLRMIFAGYDYPRDPRTFQLEGTLDDLKAHYASLGSQLGAPFAAPEGIVNELGYQHLRNGKLESAIAAFRFNVGQYPDSANVWDSLADALEQAGNKGEALASCRKAVSLAVANGDPRLEAFRKHLTQLADAIKPAKK